MRSFAIAAGFFAVAALASPVNVARGSDAEPCDDNAPPCMTYPQAQVVAQNFRQSIKNYSNESTIQHFTEDFVDYSASVNTLINGGCTGPVDLNAATFTGRENFMAGQGSQPAIPFKILNLYHTCDTVIIRWRSQGPGQEPEPVTGIIVIEAEYQANDTTDPWLIKTVYSEFNSGAWLVNLGVFTPTCPPPPPPSKRSITAN
ncbi:hypothetical protein LTR09_007933 [Extremus antarcticus]|uniref:NTF2-like domain-containing protein n=1 Tax=Extremus antarcticus TaxID=702011 RepID=A0AAJ0DI74_9PEZI|nr:hypothetical protein LTR09_007933 [Extremus antarcticus]